MAVHTTTLNGEVSEEEWSAVIAGAPSMDRLPEMVVDYQRPALEATCESPAELKLTALSIENGVRTGICFLYKALGTDFNTLFERYSLRVGTAVDVFMDDLMLEQEDLAAMEDQPEAIQYTVDEIVGRYFGYLALELYHDMLPDDLLDDNEDSETGYWLKARSMDIIGLVPSIVALTSFTPDEQAAIVYHANQTIHLMIFTIVQPDKTTVLH